MKRILREQARVVTPPQYVLTARDDVHTCLAKASALRRRRRQLMQEREPTLGRVNLSSDERVRRDVLTLEIRRLYSAVLDLELRAETLGHVWDEE